MMTSCEIKTAISTRRKLRPFNIATSTIAFSKTDRQCANMLFHKSSFGHILIALNKSNQPVNAWRDIDGIVPVRSAIVAPNRFRELLLQYKPYTLYLNDGELLRPMPFQTIQNIDDIKLTKSDVATSNCQNMVSDVRLSSSSSSSSSCCCCDSGGIEQITKNKQFEKPSVTTTPSTPSPSTPLSTCHEYKNPLMIKHTVTKQPLLEKSTLQLSSSASFSHIKKPTLLYSQEISNAISKPITSSPPSSPSSSSINNKKSKSSIKRDDDYTLKLKLYTNRALYEILDEIQSIDIPDGGCIAKNNPDTLNNLSKSKMSTYGGSNNLNINIDLNYGHRLQSVFGKNALDFDSRGSSADVGNHNISRSSSSSSSSNDDDLEKNINIPSMIGKNINANRVVKKLQTFKNETIDPLLQPMTKNKKSKKSKKSKTSSPPSSSSTPQQRPQLLSPSTSTTLSVDGSEEIIESTFAVETEILAETSSSSSPPSSPPPPPPSSSLFLPSSSSSAVETISNKKSSKSKKKSNKEKSSNTLIAAVVDDKFNMKTIKAYNDNGIVNIELEQPPSFNDMKIMDPAITQINYKLFCKEFKHQQIINMKSKKNCILKK